MKQRWKLSDVMDPWSTRQTSTTPWTEFFRSDPQFVSAFDIEPVNQVNATYSQNKIQKAHSMQLKGKL